LTLRNWKNRYRVPRGQVPPLELPRDPPSVYREFKDVEQFMRELKDLLALKAK
jgi:hypothetical protein